MKIYFVRHGQSQANLEQREQGALGALSELGREQADFVGKRFSDLPVDLIVCSPFERAKETAEIINSHLNKEMVFSDLLMERRPPTAFIGIRTDDPEYEKAKVLMREGMERDPAWRYSDEDTFTDLKKRAIQGLEYLSGLGKEHVLAVTHGGFLRMLVAVMVMGEELTYPEYRKFFFSFKTHNTGISVVEQSDDGRWSVIAWNDHAHL